MSLIHSPDAFLASVLTGGMSLVAANLKCALIDITTYDRAADSLISNVTQVPATGGYTAGGQTLTSMTCVADTVNHKTVVTMTPAVWTGATTISATGAVVYDVTSNRIVAVDDFQGTIASTGGTYTVAAIVNEYTGF